MEAREMTTGNSTLDYFLLALVFFLVLYWLRALRLAREGARVFLGNLLFVALLFLALSYFLPRSYPSLTPPQTQTLAALASVAVFLGLAKRRKRSRYIPRSVRRTFIARDLKGQNFDPHKHHIDHVWPFSKGGSNTSDNLRVIARSQNLRKHNKRPRLWDMW